MKRAALSVFAAPHPRLFPVYGVPPVNKSALILAALVVAFTVGCEPPAQPKIDTSVTVTPPSDSNVTASDSSATAPAVETPAPAEDPAPADPAPADPAPADPAPADPAPADPAPADPAPAAEAPAAEAPAAEAPAAEGSEEKPTPKAG